MPEYRYAIFLLVSALLTACSPEPIETKYRGQVMGTTWSVKVAAQSSYDPELATAIQKELDLVDALMSNWKEDSDVSKFNRSDPDTCTKVSTETLAVVLVGQSIATLSEGAFDISVGPLIELWGFGPEFKPLLQPAAEDIATALTRTGLQNLYLTDNEICKRSVQIELNLSGVAKGYAVDRVAALLNDRGFGNYLVEVGGELRARGKNGRGAPWVVGIEQPTEGLTAGGYQVAMQLLDMSVATSGDYRNFFEVEGVRYSHIINPVSGYPVEHSAASVTVLMRSAMEADAWATALLVLGPERGMEIAAQQKLSVLMIMHAEEGFEVLTSPDWPKS